MIPDAYNYPLSVALALETRAEPYCCWRNAVMALLSCTGLFSTASYVEGWIVLPRPTAIEIVEHGWISADEQIIDPSIVLIEAVEQPVCYFPGFSLNQQDLPQHLHGQILPLVCHTDFGPDGMDHPGYQDAYQQAWHLARHLAEAQSLPEAAIAVSGKTPTIAVAWMVYARSTTDQAS